MRGSLKQRSKGSWSIILDLGYELDAATGRRKRKQKWQTFHGTRKQAETKLTDLLKTVDDENYVDASTITLGAWLTEWLAGRTTIRATTRQRYQQRIAHLRAAPIGTLLLQELRATHIEAYYATAAATYKPGGLVGTQSLLVHALKKAMKLKLVVRNAALEVDERPRRVTDGAADARRHCWTVTEARAFLETTASHGAETAAFYAVALDAGLRIGELCAISWTRLDLDAGTLEVDQSLCRRGAVTAARAGRPWCGPTKSGRARTIRLAASTIRLLRTHRQQQREWKMQWRASYTDLGLVFARPDGLPLCCASLGRRAYLQLIAEAGVRFIKFHGLRHTCATLLLKAGLPVQAVSERLGHRGIKTTIDYYAHVLPDMQREAATLLDALLHGEGAEESAAVSKALANASNLVI